MRKKMYGISQSDWKVQHQSSADVQVKHAHMVLPYITVEQSAKEAVGQRSGWNYRNGTRKTPLDLIKRVKNVVKVPVFAGSGVKAENIKDQLQIADGAIIGSSLKKVDYQQSDFL